MDIIVVDGHKYSMACEPLEDYWDSENPRPEFKGICTACWRGYVAKWEIDNKELYLIAIRSFNENDIDLSVETIFPGSGGRVKATWFSGELRVPMGEMKRYVHMPYESVYEWDILMKVKDGEVIKSDFIENC